jgi:hypothetical protein
MINNNPFNNNNNKIGPQVMIKSYSNSSYIDNKGKKKSYMKKYSYEGSMHKDKNGKTEKKKMESNTKLVFERGGNEGDFYELKIVEDFNDLDPNSIADEALEEVEDTLTLLEKYVDEIDSKSLDKKKLNRL